MLKKLTNKYKKGFTLIELLVVIAIIGLLATIVMVSLNTARKKANDAAVKANLKTIMTQAAMFYDSASPNSYTGLCADPTVAAAVTQITNVGGATAVCNSAATVWAAQGSLPSAGGYWCVDSVGFTGARATALGSATVCPSS